MRLIWMVDCVSLSDHLENPTFSKCGCKRLALEIAGLRQLLWQLPDGTVVDEMSDDNPDTVRWIDTSTMLCDPLTKFMKCERMESALDSCVLDLKPTEASILAKMKKQKRDVSELPALVAMCCERTGDAPLRELSECPGTVMALVAQALSSVEIYGCEITQLFSNPSSAQSRLPAPAAISVQGP